MKISYQSKTFRKASLALIATCEAILDDYQAQGYVLTVRQLYYQLVARDVIPNTEASYNRVVRTVAEARDGGLLDWDAIEDRTRNLVSRPTWESPREIIEDSAEQFWLDLWEGQAHHVELWVEKEALAGVIQRAADRYGCSLMACRGYMSQSEIWAAGVRFRELSDTRQVVVLYLGDHDPSGIDMTRDVRDRLELYAERSIRVERLALNIDQVRQYNPPPNFAKDKDTRFQQYRDRFGASCWELDALTPDVLDGIASTAIKKYLDADLFNQHIAETEAARQTIRELARLA
jgi:hypothetical protein